MKFEVVNEKGTVVFNTEYKESLPPKQQLDDMNKNGYKFKVDGKNVTKKKLLELL